MSQQKIIAALCIISALVVVASADVTVSGCMQSLQELAGSYAPKLQEVGFKFAQAMSGSPNFNADAFMKEINEIIAGYMKLASPQTSLSPKSIYDTLTQLMGNQLGLFTRYTFNSGLTTNSIRAGSEALSNIMVINTQAMNDISTACLPGSS